VEIGGRGSPASIKRPLEGGVRLDHRSFPFAPGKRVAVLHAENARIANRVEGCEQQSKVDLPRPRLFPSRKIRQLHVTEHILCRRQKAWQIGSRDGLLIDVKKKPARWPSDGPAQAGGLDRRS